MCVCVCARMEKGVAATAIESRSMKANLSEVDNCERHFYYGDDVDQNVVFAFLNILCCWGEGMGIN